jgi:uncharacterized repeat protein (TIGR01451 family)
MSKYRIPVMAVLTMCLIAAIPAALWAGTLTSDLSVTKTHTGPDPAPGDMITYTIVVTNNGPDDAVGAGAVTVTDTFDATRLSGCSWTCAASAGSTCTVGPTAGDIADSADLLNGGTATYTATCTIDPAATGDLSNTATATSANTDPNMGDDSATDSFTLVAAPPVTEVPTAGETGLALLAMLLAAAGLWRMRQS